MSTATTNQCLKYLSMIIFSTIQKSTRNSKGRETCNKRKKKDGGFNLFKRKRDIEIEQRTIDYGNEISMSNEHLIQANNFTSKANEETEIASSHRGLRRISERNESNSNINGKEMSPEQLTWITALAKFRDAFQNPAEHRCARCDRLMYAISLISVLLTPEQVHVLNRYR